MDASASLIVRRAGVEQLDQVAPLLATSVDRVELDRLLRAGGVLVLANIALPHSTPPVAAIALDIDRTARTARVAGIGVVSVLQRRGLASRLFSGTATRLRADGVESLRVFREAATTAGAGFLAAVGFEAASGAVAVELVKWL